MASEWPIDFRHFAHAGDRLQLIQYLGDFSDRKPVERDRDLVDIVDALECWTTNCLTRRLRAPSALLS
nr:hypothetical protein [Variovorax sp. PBL-E5]